MRSSDSPSTFCSHLRDKSRSLPFRLTRMTAVLGNRTIASDASRSATASYTSSSDSTVAHLSTYADALSSYNYNYVKNKTAVQCSTFTCCYYYHTNLRMLNTRTLIPFYPPLPTSFYVLLHYLSLPHCRVCRSFLSRLFETSQGLVYRVRSA
jgi:hypothetical protein